MVPLLAKIWERIVARLYNILLILILSLLRLSNSPFCSLLSVKLQGFVVDDCGHDLVGFVGLIWWVSEVLGDDFDGVKIGVVGFGWGWERGGWVGGGGFEVKWKVRANDRDQWSKIYVLGNWRSSFAGFHSFNRRFLSLSLSSLRWSLPPCWIQWRWFVLLFLLSYSVFFINTTICLVS